MSEIKALVAGNWKMNGLKGQLGEAEAVVAGVGGGAGCDVMICPPATLLAPMKAISGDHVLVGGGNESNRRQFW